MIERWSRMLRFSHLETLIIGLVRVKCIIVQYPDKEILTAAKQYAKLFYTLLLWLKTVIAFLSYLVILYV